MAQPHVILSTILNNHWTKLLEHFTVSRDEFCTVYQNTFALAEFPLAKAPTNVPMSDNRTLALTGPGPFNPLNQFTQDLDAEVEPDGPAPDQSGAIEERDLAKSCLEVIFSTIVNPHKLYFEREEEIEIDISLKKIHKENETEDAAATAKARLDLEPSATPELVKDLIRGQVSAENRKIKAELGQLKKQLAALSGTATKNLRRGPKKTGGASTTPKKITNKDASKKKKKKSATARTTNARKADGAAPDTSHASARKNAQRKKKKNTKRN